MKQYILKGLAAILLITTPYVFGYAIGATLENKYIQTFTSSK